MTDDLIAYLLDDLSPERRAAVEERLATDFAWQRELERLKACMDGGCDPCQCAEEPVEEPPLDLVQKTCFLVEHSDDLPGPKVKSRRCGAPISAFTADSPCLAAGAKSWSLADLTIGGGVLLMVGALVMPALFESRDATRRSVCQSNLQTLGAALFNYQETRNHQLPEIEPSENAGRFALELRDHGLLTREELQQLLVCPESPLADDIAAGRVKLVLPSQAALESASGQQLAALLKSMGGSYAYRLGYFDKNGEYQQVQYTGDAQSPLMADAPGLSPSDVQIVNHAGGQWVLDQGLSVRFRTRCLGEDRDHIFLNDAGEHAAGRGPNDVVLLRSEYGPNGPLTLISNGK